MEPSGCHLSVFAFFLLSPLSCLMPPNSSCSSCIPCWDNCLNIAMAFHVSLCGTLEVSWSHSISLSLGRMSSVISPSLTQRR